MDFILKKIMCSVYTNVRFINNNAVVNYYEYYIIVVKPSYITKYVQKLTIK